MLTGFGLALSVIVPVCFSAAGTVTGLRSDRAIAQLTSVGYAGLMIGPPMIGFLSDRFGLRTALFLIPSAMLIAAAALARRAAAELGPARVDSSMEV